MFGTSTFAGYIADVLIRRYTVLTARLSLQVFAFATAGSFLVLTGFMKSTAAATVMVSISIACSGFTGGAYSCSYLDLSPHYAGVFFSVGNTFANIAGILAPIVAGELLGDNPGIQEWRHVFYVSASIYVAAIVLWVIGMKGKPLPELN